ncbi:MAG: hypothetical protein HUK02_06050 [Bacteroidaceae bacterium]|nr:hypothetical protein [Bacteroidaceae bacterium]
MTDEEKKLITDLQTRVRQLILKHGDLQKECQSLRDKLCERDLDIQALEELNREMQAQYADLKIAKTLELSDGDTRYAHRRISKLVREVDECIALLKSI